TCSKRNFVYRLSRTPQKWGSAFFLAQCPQPAVLFIAQQFDGHGRRHDEGIVFQRVFFPPFLSGPVAAIFSWGSLSLPIPAGFYGRLPKLESVHITGFLSIKLKTDRLTGKL